MPFCAFAFCLRFRRARSTLKICPLPTCWNACFFRNPRVDGPDDPDDPTPVVIGGDDPVVIPDDPVPVASSYEIRLAENDKPEKDATASQIK